jgi:hypothetical protein
MFMHLIVICACHIVQSMLLWQVVLRGVGIVIRCRGFVSGVIGAIIPFVVLMDVFALAEGVDCSALA